MTLNLKISNGIEIGHKEKIQRCRKVIEDRKKARKELVEKSHELRAMADIYRRSDPVKARLLEHRSITLADEAYRMKKEDAKPMTYEQIRRSALLGKRALLVDSEKYEKRWK